MKRLALCLLLSSVAAPICAQTSTAIAPTTAASPVLPANPSGSAILRTGTEVPLKLAEELTTKKKQVRVGQRFHLNVSDDVKVNGVVVIPVGSPAVGEITDVRNKGMWGKSGHLGAQLLYVEVNGRQIRLSGTFDDKGVTGTAGVVAAVALVPLAGFFTTGTSALLPLGGQVKGFVAEDVPLAMAAASAQPLQISAPSSAEAPKTEAAPAN